MTGTRAMSHLFDTTISRTQFAKDDGLQAGRTGFRALRLQASEPVPNLTATEITYEVAQMIRKDRMYGFALCLTALASKSLAPAHAGDDPLSRPLAQSAPLELAHAIDNELDRRNHKRLPDHLGSSQPLDVTPGLLPLTWPKPNDVRARILTPELKRTPLVGWIAENLYRSKKDNGWCLEVDPGQGEYVVFYRLHLK